MTLVFFAAVMTFIVAWLFIRRRRYEQARLTDTLSRSARSHLNLPTDAPGFERALAVVDRRKKPLSRRLLEAENREPPQRGTTLLP